MKSVASRLVGGFASLSLLVVANQSRADTPDAASMQIVSALYGRAGALHPYDFSVRLQQTCGDRATTCESFCSKAVIGGGRSGFRLPFSTPVLCRVVYRCGDEVTRATETEDGETLLLSCRRARGG